MTTKGKKTLATALVIILFLCAYGGYIYIRASEDKFIPLFTGVLFAILPVIMINFIWKKKSSDI